MREISGPWPTNFETRFAGSNQKLEEEARPRTTYQSSGSRVPSQDLAHSGQKFDTDPAYVSYQTFYRGTTTQVYPDLEEHFEATTSRSDESDHYKRLPPDDVRNEKLDVSMINHSVEIFDQDNKYSGDPYSSDPFSSLDYILKMFFNICWHAQIKPTQFHAVFPFVITGRAQKYYMDHVDFQKDAFRVAYLKIKHCFETTSIALNTTLIGR